MIELWHGEARRAQRAFALVVATVLFPHKSGGASEERRRVQSASADVAGLHALAQDLQGLRRERLPTCRSERLLQQLAWVLRLIPVAVLG